MRYIILNNKITDSEIKSRLDYIRKITNLYFSSIKKQEGIEFTSIPPDENNCLLIVGHNNAIENYLKKQIIPEKYIAIVSCKFNLNKSVMQNKKIYSTYDDNGYTYYYDGREWNLSFNVSEAELKLINSNGNIVDRIKKYFRRVI